MKSLSKAACIALALASTQGCVGGAAEVVRPKDPTYAGTVDGGSSGSCTTVGDEGSPLVVDWKPDQRGDLEAAMSQGVAVVHYDCHQIKLLPDCHVNGGYAYLGTTTQEQVINLQNADEAKANLPLNGAQIGASLSRGATLDIGLLMIGKRTTTAMSVSRDQLGERCEGATHFVRSATIGAFAMKTGTAGEVSAAAQVFGFGASAGSTSQKGVDNKSGDVDACKKADLTSGAPPDQCGAPIRIRLLAIGGVAGPSSQPADEAGKKTKPVEVVSSDVACPTGMIAERGKCAAASSAKATHLCALTDAADCQKQCDAKDAGSCLHLGYLYGTGKGGLAKDKAKAAGLYRIACDGGQMTACNNLGNLYLNGEGVESSDEKAVALYAKACNGGSAEGCYSLGDCYFGGDGVKKDEAKSVALYQRSCDAGLAKACGDLGMMVEEGYGVTASVPKALGLYQRACDGGAYGTCGYLASLYKGAQKGVAVDKAKAAKLYERACKGGVGTSCRALGKSYQKGDIVGTDAAKAKSLFDRGCQLKDSESCKLSGN